MATAHLGEDGLIPLVQNFSTGRASSFGGQSPLITDVRWRSLSDVVLVEQATTVSYQAMSDRQVTATKDNRGKRRPAMIPWKNCVPTVFCKSRAPAKTVSDYSGLIAAGGLLPRDFPDGSGRG